MSDRLLGAAEIAAMLGVSRQRVNQIVDAYPDFPEPEAVLAAGRIWSRNAVEAWLASHPERASGRQPGEVLSFEKFGVPARRVVARADEEARNLIHSYKGTEHLLLGMLVAGNVAVTGPLNASGINLPLARSAVEELIGRGNRLLLDDLPFTPRAKRALRRAGEIAAGAENRSVAPGHLLVSLLEDTDSVACQVIVTLGADIEPLRVLVRERLGRAPSYKSPPSLAGPSLSQLAAQVRAIGQSLHRIEAHLGLDSEKTGDEKVNHKKGESER